MLQGTRCAAFAYKEVANCLPSRLGTGGRCTTTTTTTTTTGGSKGGGGVSCAAEARLLQFWDSEVFPARHGAEYVSAKAASGDPFLLSKRGALCLHGDGSAAEGPAAEFVAPFGNSPKHSPQLEAGGGGGFGLPRARGYRSVNGPLASGGPNGPPLVAGGKIMVPDTRTLALLDEVTRSQ